jgi:hypothetical protein
MRTRAAVFALVALLGLGVASAFAQGGGASTTGTITGRVTDTSGAVLPGVTVTIASPSLLGQQTTTTNEQGLYRFAAVPPGVYTITYELAGFNTLRREGIQVALGFTATVNVELSVAALQETVTVTGESPVIDTSATRIQQNFKLEQLEAIPNARDMWSLLAVTPGVQMSRIDVGGNRAGTQTGYIAYGYGGQDQQVRVLVEGINTTEGTGGAGFYFDYGSFEEVFIGTAGNSAEMPHPGVMTQFLGKSGGNNFQGQIYLDWYNNKLQGSNIPDEWTAPTAFRGNPLRPHSNEMEKYYDFNLNLGGPIQRDKIWWYFSYRDQKNAVRQVNFLFDKTFDTRLWNPSGKGTYQMSRNHKFIGYYQWGQKIQPNRLYSGAFTYAKPEYTRRQDSGSWVWKGEWNGTLSQNLYVEVRYGDFGYFFPLVGYSDEPWKEDSGRRTVEGGDWRWQQDRDRKQFTGAATYYKDGWAGSHSFKFGGEVNREGQWNGIERWRPGHVQHQFVNGVPDRVIIGFPTADCKVGSKSAHDCLLSIARLDHSNFFLSDQWALGRVTLNLGMRYDHYRSWIPEQRQLEFRIGNIFLPAQTFPETTFFTWDSVVPRLGLIYDLAGDGRTVLKLNYGYFKHNPGPGIAASANPNQNQKTVTYSWRDLNGDGLWQPGEEGTLLADNRAGAIQIDPNISQPFTHEAAAFVERQLLADLGVRVGFVYKTNDNLWQTYRPFRTGPYTADFQVLDIGPDGIRGTSDDVMRTFKGIPTSQLGPATAVIQNVPAIGRYKTLEASMQKRVSHRWSLTAGGFYTWTKEHGNSYRENTVSPSFYPQSPNDTSLHEFTTWGFNASGILEGPYGLRVSPVFRHQSGHPYGRTLRVTPPAGIFFHTGTPTVLVEPLNTRRMDNIYLLDLRVERRFQFARTMAVRGFLDLFNLFNTHAAEIISFETGPAFERPLQVVAPFTARVGFRFEW